MSGSSLVIDSNILIYLSKGLIKIEDVLLDYQKHLISIVTYMEVLGFNLLKV